MLVKIEENKSANTKYLTSPRSAGERHILDDLSEVVCL